MCSLFPNGDQHEQHQQLALIHFIPQLSDVIMGSGGTLRQLQDII